MARQFWTPLLTAEVFASILLAVAILSGKLGIARFIPQLYSSSILFEVRFWATLATLVFLLFSRQLHVNFERKTIILLASIYALLLFLLIRSSFVVGSFQYLVDIIYLSIQIFLFAVLSRNKHCIAALGLTGLAVAAGLFALAAAGVNDAALNGAGWAPGGGPFTFYRIEFLGLCASLYLYLTFRSVIFAPAISLFLFATCASLSKAAVLASLLALLIVGATLIIRRQFKSFSIVTVAILAGYLAWQIPFGVVMEQRIASAIEAEPQDQTNSPARKLVAGQDFRVEIEYCELSPQEDTKCYQRSLVDRSGRLNLIAKAIAGFLESPVIGNGMGEYSLLSRNRYTGATEFYKYPHNLFFEIAFNGGLVALVLLFFVLALSINAAHDALRTDAKNSAIVAFGAFILLSALVAGDLYDWRLFLFTVVIASNVSLKASSNA